jgi:GNAT superfamily N-acetyltransferase
MPLELEIRRLQQQDLCGDFRSGSERLDDFFRRYAKQTQARQHTATFVALVTERIAGFVTIVPASAASLPLKGHVKNLSNFPAPVLLLARMATDARFQKQGIGGRLLYEVFTQAAVLADGFGCVGIYVDPKPDAIAFYAKHDFVALQVETVPPPMFLPMGTVRAVMHAEIARAGS